MRIVALLVFSFTALSLQGTVALAGDLQVKSPSNGDILTVGNSMVIVWDKPEKVSTVNLSYSKLGDFTDAVTISSGEAGTSYNWIVPNAAISASAKIKVWDATDPSTEDDSDDFIIKGIVMVTAPTSGDILDVGSLKTITWVKTSTIGTVGLCYSGDGSNWTTIIASTASTSFAWTVPHGAVSCKMRIKVMDADAGHPLTEGISEPFVVNNGSGECLPSDQKRASFYPGGTAPFYPSLRPRHRLRARSGREDGRPYGDATQSGRSSDPKNAVEGRQVTM